MTDPQFDDDGKVVEAEALPYTLLQLLSWALTKEIVEPWGFDGKAWVDESLNWMHKYPDKVLD